MKTKIQRNVAAALLSIALAGIPLFASGQNDGGGGASSGENPKVRFMKRGIEGSESYLFAINEYVEEKFAIELEWILPNRDSYNEKVNIAFASGEYPELMDIMEYPVIINAAESGVLIPVEDIIEKSPVWSQVDPALFSAHSVNGTVYGLPSSTIAPNVLVYRKDWADRLGLKPPAGADEFYEMMRAFTKDDPDGNGRDDTYGLTSRLTFLTTDPVLHEPFWRYFLPEAPNSFYERDGKIIPAWYHGKELGEALEWLQRAYREGLIDPEFIIDTKQTHQQKFDGGTTGIWQKQFVWLDARIKVLQKSVPEAELAVVPSVTNSFGKKLYQTRGTSLTAYITDAAEPEIKKIKDFYSWYQSSPGQMAQMLGIEGVTYRMEDGGLLPIGEAGETALSYYYPAILPLTFPGIENPPGYGDFSRSMAEQTDFESAFNTDTVVSRSEMWKDIAPDVQKILKEVIVETIIGSQTPDQAIEKIEAMNKRFRMDDVLADINKRM